MKKIIIFLMYSYMYIFAGDFGTILSNAIIINMPTKNQKNMIANIHKGLLRLAKERMSRQIKSEGEKLVIKFFNRNDPDIKIEQEITESVTTIVKESEKYKQNININEDITNFRNFSVYQNSGFDPVGTIAQLIIDIKKFYGEDDGMPLVAIYNSNGENKVKLKALFAIVYKIEYNKNEDKQYLKIHVIYSSTKIIEDEHSNKNVMLQELSRKIDISEGGKISKIAGIIYKPLNQKISNLLNNELGN